MMKNYRLIVLALLYINTVTAQQKFDESNYPVVGKLCPNFMLHNIKYYSKKEAVLTDFRGKWLILDFWNKGCSACVASFPKINELRNKYGEKLEWMLVGIQDKEKQIEPMYKRFREKENLAMPCAFDSTLANRWLIYTAPHLIVIDPQGVIQAITVHLEESDLKAFLRGETRHLYNPYRYDFEKDNKMTFDANKPYLINGNGGNDTSFLFRSVLSAFDGSVQNSSFPRKITQDSIHAKFQILGASLTILFNYAYYGNAWPDKQYQLMPVLEMRNKSIFNSSGSNNRSLFCYSLIVPESRASDDNMKRIMKNDLENYFGLIATIEKRDFPIWRLVATEKAKKQLKTKGGPSSFDVIIPKVKFSAKNYPFNQLITIIRNMTDEEIQDDTGINENIDIQMDCILTDINEVKKELNAKGLEFQLINAKKNVLVIRDSKSAVN